MTTYQKLNKARQELRNDEWQEKNAIASKITPINDPMYIANNAYKSAKDVAKVVGTDKVYTAIIDWRIIYNWSDGTETDSGSFQVFLFAQDEADAKSRLKLMFKSSEYLVTDVHEVTQEAALAQIKKNLEDPHYPHGGTSVDVCNHILVLPTQKMYDEMKKSIDWANNMLKRLKDQDEASRRAAWLQTPEGKAWLAKYEADKKLVDELQKKYDDQVAKAKAKEEQEEKNADEVLAILKKKPEKYPQYKDGIAPVIVEGGRKFKGKGFAISWEDCDGMDTYVPTYNSNGSIAHNYDFYHRGDEWTNAIIYDPATKKIQKANIKYCKVDTSVPNEQCVNAFRKYCEQKVASTIEWCKSKDPSKSQYELQRWAKNIIKKYHPWIDVDKYIKFDQKDVENAEAKRVASTVDWAISLHKGQAETERIIMRALAKKGINYKNFKEVITMKLHLAFGKDPKVISF